MGLRITVRLGDAMSRIRLEQLNREEAIRYLGVHRDNEEAYQSTMELIERFQGQVLEEAEPAYVYRVFEVTRMPEGIKVEGTNLVLPGNDIRKHLNGCSKVALMAVTVSSHIDRLIRVAQLEDMAKAVVIDSLASVAVEQLCDRVEELIAAEFPEYYLTYRYGVGYGDLPISLQKDFINVLNAGKTIGLGVSKASMLIPSKSVTAVIGLSDAPLNKGVRGCVNCNLKNVCQYREKGGRCNG